MARSSTLRGSGKYLVLLLAAPALFGQATNEFNGVPGQSTPLTAKITNSCKDTETFNVHPTPGVPWLSLPSPTSIEVAPGTSKNYTFNLAPPADMAGGTYSTNIAINCLACSDETPPCKQSDSKFPISLVIPKTNDGSGGGAAGGSGGKKTGVGSPFPTTPNSPQQSPPTTPPTTPPTSATPTSGGTTPGNLPGGQTTSTTSNGSPTGTATTGTGKPPTGTSSTGTAEGNPPTNVLTPATPGSATQATTETAPTPTAPAPASLPAVLGGLITALGAATLLLGSGTSLVKDILQAVTGTTATTPAATTTAATPSGTQTSTTPTTTAATTPTTTSTTTDGGTPTTPTATTPTPTDPSDIPAPKDPSDLSTNTDAGGMWDASLQTPAQGGTMADAPINPPAAVLRPHTTPLYPGETVAVPVTTQATTTTSASGAVPGTIAYAPPTPEDPSDIDVPKDPSDLPRNTDAGGMWDASLQSPTQDVMMDGPTSGTPRVVDSSTTPAITQDTTTTTGGGAVPGTIGYAPSTPKDPSDIDVPKDPSDLPRDTAVGGMWDAALQMPAQGAGQPGGVMASGAPSLSFANVGDYYNPQKGELGSDPGDGWIRLGPTPPIPGIPKGATVSYIPGQEPHLFVDPKTGKLTWVMFGEDAPYGWMPLTPSVFYPASPEGAGDYYDPKTGEVMHANMGQAVPVGWKKLKPVNPLSTRPGEEPPKRYVEPGTGNNGWFRPGEESPAGWVPLTPAFTDPVSSEPETGQSTESPPQQGAATNESGQDTSGGTGHDRSGGGEYFNPKTGDTVTFPPGKTPPDGWKKLGPVSLPPGVQPGMTVSYIPGREPRLYVNPETGETKWFSWDEPHDGWIETHPKFLAESGVGGTKTVQVPGGLSGQLGQDPTPPSGTKQPQQMDGGAWRPSLTDPPAKPPNYGPGGILNQPLGEDPPPAKPNYGPGGILNQPLGEDPPPVKPVAPGMTVAPGTPQSGHRNAGGGHTFSRGTTKEDLDKANRPVTPEEQAAAKSDTSDGGTDETGARWRETNKGMVEKANAEDPWDGKYDPKGESDWLKGVREDKAAAEARLKKDIVERWGGNENGVVSGVKGAAYDQVYGDPIRHEQDLILRRVWQIEIYEAAYKKARLLGLSNLAAHAYAQIQLDKWRDKSLEDFEQAFGTHFAQLGQAISGDPIGNLNKAIEKIGALVDEAVANVEKSRELAKAIEKQRLQAQEAAELEKIASEETNVGAKSSGPRLPDPAGYTRTRNGIKAQIKDVNFLSQSKSNCVSCAVATDSALAGKPMGAFPDFDGMKIRKTIDFICDRFNTMVKPMGKGAAAQQQIIQALEKSGEGSRGIVVVVVGEDAHAFNAVLRDGKVFFPDGQIGDFRGLSIFQKSDGVLFFPTGGGG